MQLLYHYLCGLKNYDVTLTSVIFSEVIILQADITSFMYIYMCVVYFLCHLQICTNDYLIIVHFLQREIILLFTCSLVRTTENISNSNRDVSRIAVGS